MDDAPGRDYIPRMPDIALSRDELQAVAMACRIGAAQAVQDAEHQDNPRIKLAFAEAAARYTALSERFESARQGDAR
jgi:nitrogen-specific signal transduction histidine kinase